MIDSYMRRDIFEQEKEDEQEPVIDTSSLRQSDLESILCENKKKKASIQEEYHMLLQLRSDLSKRLTALKAHPIKIRDFTSDVFVPTKEFQRWIQGTELIQRVVAIFDANPVIRTQPKLRRMTAAEEEAQRQLNRTDAEYVETDQPEVLRVDTDSLITSIVQILKRNLKEKLRMQEVSGDDDSDLNTCTHGRLDPICIPYEFILSCSL